MIMKLSRAKIEGELKRVIDLIEYEKKVIDKCLSDDNIVEAAKHHCWLGYYIGQKDLLEKLLSNVWKE